MDTMEMYVAPPTGVRGEPTRIWLAQVVTVGAGSLLGTVDIQPYNSRATKAGVPFPSWYSPVIGDAVLACDVDGDPLTPRVIAPAGNRVTAATVAAELAAAVGVNYATGVRRGKSIIATSEVRDQAVSGTGFGYLTTPDRVQNIVLPTDGLIFVAYMATWAESVLNSAAASIALNGVLLNAGGQSNPGWSQRAGTNGTGNKALHTSGYGLCSANASSNSGFSLSPTHVTTGESFAKAPGTVGSGSNTINPGYDGGACPIFAAAGTYEVGIQFATTSTGTVTVSSRKLWVWTMGF